MAQKHLEVLKIHEGELSDVTSGDENTVPTRKEDRHLPTLSGSTVNELYLSDKVTDATSYLYRQCKPYGGCQRNGCKYASKSSDKTPGSPGTALHRVCMELWVYDQLQRLCAQE